MYVCMYVAINQLHKMIKRIPSKNQGNFTDIVKNLLTVRLNKVIDLVSIFKYIC